MHNWHDNPSQLRPFHLAFPVDDLDAARKFYGEVIGCSIGRSSDHWIDFNFYGHQIVAHLTEESRSQSINIVDDKSVPVPHFGIILKMPDWQDLAERLRLAGTKFIIEPSVRFAGEIGEQATMFFYDPAGNALEFKAFADDGQIFAK